MLLPNHSQTIPRVYFRVCQVSWFLLLSTSLGVRCLSHKTTSTGIHYSGLGDFSLRSFVKPSKKGSMLEIVKSKLIRFSRFSLAIFCVYNDFRLSLLLAMKPGFGQQQVEDSDRFDTLLNRKSEP